MKKILSLLGTITLIGTSTPSLVACNKKHEYTPEELEKFKKENKINTKNQTIRDNLEWIAPQEKPFNKIDDKYYFVVWRGDKNDNWRIAKFKNDNIYKKIDEYNNFWGIRKAFVNNYGDGIVINKIKNNQELRYRIWPNNDYFKAVYRWNLDIQEPNLIVDKDGMVKVNEI
ncbi:lipoprotein [Spiroplasma endosymbiont of Seladonia tumulorum]|uniref:lipoprotein n=1 Tax=Spiroplasma endosymbiont of Seladonia tumulorum TaxID=3066321 RepID=UPI0030CEEB99